jgi:hypothetical protein
MALTKVRMVEGVSGGAMRAYGIDGDFSHKPGDIVELHADLAKHWIASGRSVKASSSSSSIQAAATPTEEV